MEEKDFEKLKETIGQRGLSTAINMETEMPVLSHVRNDPKLGYIHPVTFVDKLEEKGFAIDPLTLNITEAVVEKPKPPEIPMCANVPGCGKTQDKCMCTPTPESEIWTRAELTKMSYKNLQAVAKKDPEVPADKKKAELIELLTGRLKL